MLDLLCGRRVEINNKDLSKKEKTGGGRELALLHFHM